MKRNFFINKNIAEPTTKILIFSNALTPQSLKNLTKK